MKFFFFRNQHDPDNATWRLLKCCPCGSGIRTHDFHFMRVNCLPTASSRDIDSKRLNQIHKRSFDLLLLLRTYSVNKEISLSYLPVGLQLLTPVENFNHTLQRIDTSKFHLSFRNKAISFFISFVFRLLFPMTCVIHRFLCFKTNQIVGFSSASCLFTIAATLWRYWIIPSPRASIVLATSLEPLYSQ